MIPKQTAGLSTTPELVLETLDAELALEDCQWSPARVELPNLNPSKKWLWLDGPDASKTHGRP